jgi:hypothetical protein
MNLCGTNFFPILISVACCGLIFVYFNVRLAEIKVTVEKQNRVLTAFITNVQTDLRSSGAHSMASPEALKAAQTQTQAQAQVQAQAKKSQDKIVVSDDEDDDDDSDSDSESESEGDVDEIIDINSSEIPLEMMTFAFEVLPELSTSEPITSSSSISEITDETLNLESLDKNEEVSYESMRVDDLRKIVADKNLSTKEEVKKLKKPELLLLLKK